MNAKAKIRFLKSMATLLDAGLPIIRALSRRHPKPYRRACAGVVKAIEEDGASFADAAAAYPECFGLLETRLFAVGEKSGDLPGIMNALSGWFEAERQMRVKALSGLIYPLMLYHVATLVLPVMTAFVMGGNLVTALIVGGALSVAPYALFALVSAIVKCRALAGVTGGLALSIPLLGGFSRQRDCARFFSSLRLALDAGLVMSEAVALAAGSCANPILRNCVEAMARDIEGRREPLSAAWRRHWVGGDGDMAEMLETGEESGRLDDTAVMLAAAAEYDAKTKMDLFAKLAPKILYVIICLGAAALILRFYIKLFARLGHNL